MRQLLTLRFCLTLLALLALTGVAMVIASHNEDAKPEVLISEPAGRSVDFVALVQTAQLPLGFAMVGGRANADLYLVIDAARTMLVKEGTPGEIDCPLIAEPSQCIVAADLLGDGVLWFSLIPGTAVNRAEIRRHVVAGAGVTSSVSSVSSPWSSPSSPWSSAAPASVACVEVTTVASADEISLMLANSPAEGLLAPSEHELLGEQQVRDALAGFGQSVG